jgi:hypothetical protein
MLSTVLVAIAALAALSPETMLAEQGRALATAVRISPPEAASGCKTTLEESHPDALCKRREPLIVIGFMGGRVRAGNLVHKEALLVRNLDRQYPNTVHAMTFANHDEQDALRFVLRMLDSGKDGYLSEGEKSAARIVIFGHSWGASETVNFAKELDRRGIPVLLTIQVDSVEKSGEDDGSIPPNVREAINFYQAEGRLHGRSSIQAIDPKRTTILGSYESSYKANPVSCAGYSWYARAFMKPHIEIENDGAVWDRIEALIVARSCETDVTGTTAACIGE